MRKPRVHGGVLSSSTPLPIGVCSARSNPRAGKYYDLGLDDAKFRTNDSQLKGPGHLENALIQSNL